MHPTAALAWFPLLGLLAVAACKSRAPAPVAPLRGPVPTAIVVWPELLGGPLALGISGLDDAVRARGYRVPSVAVVRESMRALGAVGDGFPEADLRAKLGATLSADAVLCCEVLRWQVEGEPVRFASWHLRWTMSAAQGAAELWRQEHSGSWAQVDPGDAQRRLDEEAPFVPIGGDRRRAFRSGSELLAQLHLDVLATLPPGR
ncbi:MAG: hypothetical protein MUC36_26290 [Planctomycetes bacterium]|jgi:hypothetical protein|nr:hypothetical protein [Planctomycetota bacterium]